MHNAYNFERDFERSITNWFQPIYNLKENNIIGYEALLRDSMALHISPADIFKDADKIGCRNSLDRKSIKNSIEIFKGNSCLLFINVFTSTLLSKNFLHWWDINIPSDKCIVLEISEIEPILNYKDVNIITKELKDRGVKIALDDMGTGYSSIRHWIELAPDFIKLDKYFSEKLSINTKKQMVIKSMIELLSDTTEIILEGIEKETDLDTALFLGITLGQGYLMGKPSPYKQEIFVF